MIYLIDDKIQRQKEYGWDSEEFKKFEGLIKVWYRYSEFDSNEIFQAGNVLLYHESFFNNIENFESFKGSIDEISDKLNEFSNRPNFKIVKFSGGYSSRKLDSENSAILRVETFYNNLNAFLSNAKDGNIDLRFILFGENYDVEVKLLQKRDLVLDKFNGELKESPIITEKRVEFFREKGSTLNPFFERSSKVLFDKYCEDEEITKKIIEWFSEKEVDFIFIPLCFGPVLSDFNGLRLATHLRTTDSRNQNKNIFIYGFVDLSDLINHECFDILKTKNVFLIDYSKEAFVKALDFEMEELSENELIAEIKKIKLDVPQDIGDSHSIANRWAIYRWAKTLNASDHSIKKIERRIDSNLYFKYLKTIYPITSSQKIQEEDLKIISEEGKRILYIDDEADIGWYENFCTILYDANKIDFDYLGDDLKGKTRQEIIELASNKAKEYDLVILDFRLHPKDFKEKDLTKISGYQILQKIKDFNKGIQVLIFSATNKIWNYEFLMESGADGFILKEGIENSNDSMYSIQSIKNLVKQVEESLKMSFLIKILEKINVIKKNLNTLFEKNQDKINELNTFLDIGYDLLNKTRDDKKYFSYAYIQFFQIIESFSSNDFFIKSDNTNNLFIVLDDKNTICIQKSAPGELRRKIIYKYASYYKGKETVDSKDIHWKGTYFRISAILIFKYGLKNSRERKWQTINENRNTRAAHYSKNKPILIGEIDDVLDLLLFMTDKKNFSSKSKNEGFKNVREGTKILKSSKKAPNPTFGDLIKKQLKKDKK